MVQGLSFFQNGKKQLFSDKTRLGDAARDERAWDRAAAHYRDALEINPKADGIWVQLGHSQKELGMFGKAEESYRRALDLNPENSDTSVQLGHLFSVRHDVTNALKYYREAAKFGSRDPIVLEYLEKHSDHTDSVAFSGSTGSSPIYFDYSDLVQYFQHNRFPTGIQRVQIELFKAAQESESDVPLRACAFVDGKNFWVELDPIAFRRLCDLSSLPGGAEEPVWISAVDHLLKMLEMKARIRFPQNSTLINVGTSWWIKDYGTYVRHAKQRFGLRYVPFVHDLIPLLTPEHCSKGLVEEFKAWIESVMLQADFIAVNSTNTKNDVIEYGKQRFALQFEPKVVRLDAEFARTDIPSGGQEFLIDSGLVAGKYVLFVGTLESRKNHVGVFQAWKKLMTAHGVDATPTLVCVGKRGWLFDQASSLLEADSRLASKIALLSGISDDELAALYKGCLFTVYASHYEGWGLPVTESLSFGKVCLSANNSSLPEAGSRFADYFDNDSVPDIVSGLNKLVFDDQYRVRREAEIARDFKPREWVEVLHDLVGGVTDHFSAARKDSRGPAVAQIEPGVFYDFGAKTHVDAGPDRAVAEMLRHELSWHPVEAWGTWARNKNAKLAFKFSPASHLAHDEVLVYLKLVCGPESTEVTVRLGSHVVGEVSLQSHETRFVRFTVRKSWLVLREEAGEYNVMVFDHKVLVSLSESSEDADNRVIGVGLCGIGMCDPDDFEFRLDIRERQDMLIL
ncbi:glycosyltransferase involved in cell wall biosynthesis [Paraburkholderia sp. WC7.3g]|uniref:glycosyltransferase n=1 Tax=Paraburkholderia sp. WC7.3g TaxID=2991070 RepID=UPI003D1F4045